MAQDENSRRTSGKTAGTGNETKSGQTGHEKDRPTRHSRVTGNGPQRKPHARGREGTPPAIDRAPRPRPASVYAAKFVTEFLGASGNAAGGAELSAPVVTVRDMWKEYAGRTWLRVAAVVAVGFLSILIGFQVYLTYYSDVKTEVVRLTSYSETIDVEGISFRDEIPLSAAVGGSAVGAVRDGEKVSQGQAVINIFGSDKAAAAYRRVTEIDREIEKLKSMVTAYEDSAEAVTNIEKILDEQLMSLNADVYDHDLRKVPEIKNNLSYLMNKRLVAMRKVEDYSGRIEKLEQEKASLENAYSQNPSAVTAPSSGYYVNALDGYEEALTPSALPTLTAEGLSDLLSRTSAKADNGSGKIMRNYVWYLACPVPKEKAEDYLAVGSVYTLFLPYSGTGSLQATLLYLNEEEDSDKVLAVFKCGSLGAELSHIRRQPVRIQIRSFEGYYVKKSALHVAISQVEDKDKEGNVIGTHEERNTVVYVVIAGQLFSRRVRILYSGEKFVICSAKTPDSHYLAMYDEVVTEGKDLYERKIVS